MTEDAKTKQVADQCKVVAHLANVLASVHSDYEVLIRSGKVSDIVDDIGRRTASLMEDLGNILNGMDAVSKDDEWTHPVFEARETFGFAPVADAALAFRAET